MFCYSYSFVFLSIIKLKSLDILKFLVTALRNQDKKYAFIVVDKDVALAKYFEFMRTCYNMNTIV